jgi:hypothetical protein
MRYVVWLPLRLVSVCLLAIVTVFGFLRAILREVTGANQVPPSCFGNLLQLVLLPIWGPIFIIYLLAWRLYQRTIDLDVKYGFAKRAEVERLREKTGVAQRGEKKRISEVEQARSQSKMSKYEGGIPRSPVNEISWEMLWLDYYKEERYKDMENHLKKVLASASIRHPALAANYYDLLGNIYLAALSVAIRGKGIPIMGYEVRDVRPDVLGYTSEELRTLARDNLTKAYEIERKSWSGDSLGLKGAELKLKVSNDPSIQSFQRYDRYMEECREKESHDQEEAA